MFISLKVFASLFSKNCCHPERVAKRQGRIYLLTFFIKSKTKNLSVSPAAPQKAEQLKFFATAKNYLRVVVPVALAGTVAFLEKAPQKLLDNPV
ncbi:hypothetical protein LJC45_02000 [Alistipes sp. OttesenSCG-928-B03]|nr:hypothetical protein [Alistipes sp. OttesenSCG-928-B03]